MKIVIVGGGTAGWITAAFFIKHTIGHDITVIESSKIGIIGAGEGSTGTLPWFIKGDGFPWPDNQVDELDFLRKTKATLKLGINLKDWNGIGTQFYSPVEPTDSSLGSIDSDFKVHKGKTIRVPRKLKELSKGEIDYLEKISRYREEDRKSREEKFIDSI